MERLRSQLEALQQERDTLSEHLHDQAKKAGEWYERVKALERELEQLRSQSDEVATAPATTESLSYHCPNLLHLPTSQ